jgi:ankyrin repeat protein
VPALCYALDCRGTYSPNTPIAMELLRYGANPNVLDRDGATPLMLAVSASVVNRDLVEMLLRHGANVHARDRNGQTVLFYSNSDPALTSRFLGLGVSPHARDADGKTPLFAARTTAVAKLLVDRGADIHAKDSTGTSVLSYQIGVNWRADDLHKFLTNRGARP